MPVLRVEGVETGDDVVDGLLGQANLLELGGGAAFDSLDGAERGRVKGMKIKTPLKVPQVGLPKETVNDIIARLDALDAE